MGEYDGTVNALCLVKEQEKCYISTVHSRLAAVGRNDGRLYRESLFSLASLPFPLRLLS